MNKLEYRSSNSESNSNSQKKIAKYAFELLKHSSFGFVSSFDIRISIFNSEVMRNCYGRRNVA